jgi:hypothetical protein
MNVHLYLWCACTQRIPNDTVPFHALERLSNLIAHLVSSVLVLLGVER